MKRLSFSQLRASRFFTPAIVCTTVIGLPFASHAQVTSGHSSATSLTKGAAARVLLPAPGGEFESCYLPKYYADYIGSENDRKEEIKLCRMSGYDLGDLKIEIQSPALIDPKLFKKLDTKSVIFCPKLNSTVPATNFVDLPKGWKSEDAQKMFCTRRENVPVKFDDLYSLEAKLKSTLGGASARSVVAYYHFSRLLDTGRVAPAVFRTLRRSSHETVVGHANTALKGGTDYIAQNWAALGTSNQRAAAGRPNTELYVDGGQQIFGALMENEKGEEKHTEVSGVGDFKTRYPRFMTQPPFLRLSNPDSVVNIAGSNTIEKLAPVIVEMREMAGMVLLDTMLSQADRIGNVHYKIAIIENTPDGAIVREMNKEEKNAAKNVLAAVRAPLYEQSEAAYEKGNTRAAASLRARADKIKLTEKMVIDGIRAIDPSRKPIVSKIIIMKDNDAGISGKNPMRSHAVLEKIRHMDPELYRRFLRLADEILSDRFKPFAMDTLLFRASDYEGTPNSLKENTRHALNVLKAACRSGQLKFDLTMKFDARGVQVPQPAPSCE
jgi:hypothetical protein